MHIVFDGPDGVGKTSTMGKLYYQLCQLQGQEPDKGTTIDHNEVAVDPKPNFSIYRYHQPGSTKLGDKIRDMIKDKDIPACAMAQFYSMLAQHFQYCDEVLKPLYEAKGRDNVVVFQDRYSPTSAYAYSVTAKGISHIDYRNGYDHYSLRPFTPDVIIIFQASIDTILRRIAKRPDENPGYQDRFENKDNLIKAIRGYKEVIKGGVYPESQYLIIDAEKDKEFVYGDVLKGLIAHPNIKNHKVLVSYLERMLEIKGT